MKTSERAENKDVDCPDKGLGLCLVGQGKPMTRLPRFGLVQKTIWKASGNKETWPVRRLPQASRPKASVLGSHECRGAGQGKPEELQGEHQDK